MRGRRRDVKDVAGHGLRQAHRPRVPQARPGWGGSCFPKDSRALVHIAESAGYKRFDLLKGVITVNDEQFHRVADKVRTMVGGDLNGKKVAVWGLTFKARTDDIRDSPAVGIAGLLADAGAAVHAYDPAAKGDIGGIDRAADPVLGEGADVLVVLTEVGRVPPVDFDKVAGLMTASRWSTPATRSTAMRLERRGLPTGIGH